MKSSYGPIIVLALLLPVSWLPWALGAGGTIGILPPSTTLNFWAGESGSYEVKIHNGMGREVTVRLTVVVSQVPTGGSALHIALSFPDPVTVKPGNTFVPVAVGVSPAAMPGSYLLNHAVSL